MNDFNGATTADNHPGYRGAGDRGDGELDDAGETGVRGLLSVVGVAER